MIASALRAEIERSTSTMGPIRPGVSGPPPSPLLKAALPALTGQLDDRSGLAAPSSTAAHLARCAFFQHLAAQKGLTYIRTIEERCGLPHEALGFVGHGPAECRDRMEAALDAIDALVDDPTQLPVLRNDLCVMIAQVQRLCAEEPRIEKSRDVHISAA